MKVIKISVIEAPENYSKGDTEAIEAALVSIEDQIKVVRRNIKKHPYSIWISVRGLVWKSSNLNRFIRDTPYTD